MARRKSDTSYDVGDDYKEYDDNSIYALFRNEIGDFSRTYVEIVPGYYFNQKETLKRIELYNNSKFESGETDTEGFHKFFYNISQFACETAAKALDVDTKDYKFIPDTKADVIPTLFMSREMKLWMRQNHWGSTLNDITDDLPVYGSIVLRKTRKGIAQVNIHNIVNDPSVSKLSDGPVIETLPYTADDLMLEVENGWDAHAIQEVIERYNKDGQRNQILVQMRHGYVNRSKIEPGFDPSKDEDKLGYYVIVCAGVEKISTKRKGNQIASFINYGQVLFYQKIDPKKDFPYRELHYRKRKGRWLGYGVVERNFDAQIRQNELQNIKSKALYWAGRIVFQTLDDSPAKNLLTDLVNGEILRVKSEIKEIGIRNIDLNAFREEEQRWDKNVSESVFSLEALPQGSTAKSYRGQALQKLAADSFYKKKRENVGLFLRDLFFEFIIPQFKADKKKKHMLSLGADDKDREGLLSNYAEFLLYNHLETKTQNRMMILTKEAVDAERQRIKSRLLSSKNTHVEAPDEFYDNAKFHMELVITEEQIDLGQKAELVTQLFQTLAANPQVLQDENLRNLLTQVLATQGFSLLDLGISVPTTQPQPNAQPAQQPTQAQPNQPKTTPAPAAGGKIPTPMQAQMNA